MINHLIIDIVQVLDLTSTAAAEYKTTLNPFLWVDHSHKPVQSNQSLIVCPWNVSQSDHLSLRLRMFPLFLCVCTYMLISLCSCSATEELAGCCRLGRPRAQEELYIYWPTCCHWLLWEPVKSSFLKLIRLWGRDVTETGRDCATSVFNVIISSSSSPHTSVHFYLRLWIIKLLFSITE